MSDSNSVNIKIEYLDQYLQLGREYVNYSTIFRVIHESIINNLD
jgi:hypothetical protein